MLMVQLLRARMAGRESSAFGFFGGENVEALFPGDDFSGEVGQNPSPAGTCFSDSSTMKRFRFASRALSDAPCRCEDVSRM